ncbi:hypothetical protein L3Y34_004633 [Caenorhabditis briggsae]|uniref:CUB-like domain-containing protein n=1 Tax=Caenorhabditis briggsae TaxID=6238 RepID=A0AAE9AEC9_CAEBR|nr:hypothetical protein L3Y34_004633 [Caenorhabditis briggsae]
MTFSVWTLFGSIIVKELRLYPLIFGLLYFLALCSLLASFFEINRYAVLVGLFHLSFSITSFFLASEKKPIFGEESTQPPLVNACLERQDLNPELPINISKTVSFPNDTNITFLENKGCSWAITIPNNYFAILYINAYVPIGGSISVTQSPNHTEKFVDHHVEVALLFVAPSFNLNWFSGNSSKGSIHFTVNWQSFPENMTTQNYTLERNSSSIILDHEDTYTPVVFHAATKVSILCLPGTQREEDTYLRTGIVFDGPDLNSPFLGSLYSIMRSQSQLISTNSTVTIFSIVPIVSHHHVIVQDASMYQNISQIIGLNVNDSAVEIIKINAQSGNSVVFTHNNNPLIDEYLISVDLESGNELQVYFEGLSENQRVATYSTKNNRTHLPQKLQGRLRYYVLSSGNATLSLTRDKWKANWEKAFSGRRGFFTSKYWKSDNKQMRSQQDSFHFIGKEERNATEFRFSYRFLEADLSGDNNIHVVVSDNVQRIHYYDHRTSSEYTNDTEWYSHYGHSISLVYSSINAQSTGFFAEFEIDSASGNYSFWFIFVIVVSF